MTPYDAHRIKEILKLKEDNFPRKTDKFSILLGENTVSIHCPEGGGYVVIPKRQFNKIVDWYLEDQTKEVKNK